jgi:hypothetical protein
MGEMTLCNPELARERNAHIEKTPDFIEFLWSEWLAIPA